MCVRASTRVCVCTCVCACMHARAPRLGGNSSRNKNITPQHAKLTQLRLWRDVQILQHPTHPTQPHRTPLPPPSPTLHLPQSNPWSGIPTTQPAHVQHSLNRASEHVSRSPGTSLQRHDARETRPLHSGHPPVPQRWIDVSDSGGDSQDVIQAEDTSSTASS